MESDKSQLSEKAQAKRGFSIVSVVQFLGASSIVAITTWSLNSIISAKSNQQEQLNTFINTISDFMIKNNLDGQTTNIPLVPAVSRAARGYALNTLNTLDGVLFIEDKPKKLALLKFLYDSELIGYCKNSIAGGSQSIVETKCYDTRIKLKDARLRGLVFSNVGSIAIGVDFSGADLTRSDFSKMDLTHSKFRRSVLRSAKFNDSILQFADLSSAYLVDAELIKADLTNSILDDSQLCGANLTGATGFHKAKLNRVTFDAGTKLPAGGRELLIANKGIEVPPKECRVTRIFG